MDLEHAGAPVQDRLMELGLGEIQFILVPKIDAELHCFDVHGIGLTGRSSHLVPELQLGCGKPCRPTYIAIMNVGPDVIKVFMIRVTLNGKVVVVLG